MTDFVSSNIFLVQLWKTWNVLTCVKLKCVTPIFHSMHVHMAVRAVAYNHGLSPQFSYVTEIASHLTVTL